MKNFRIISDMTRDKETDPGNAGANFMKAINGDFKDIKKLIYYEPLLKISLVDLNKRLFRYYHYDNYMSYEWIDNGIATLNKIIQKHLIKKEELDFPF